MTIEDLAEDLKTVESVLEAVTDELSALRARIEALENRVDPLLSLPEATRTRGEALPASNDERGDATGQQRSDSEATQR